MKEEPFIPLRIDRADRAEQKSRQVSPRSSGYHLHQRRNAGCSSKLLLWQLAVEDRRLNGMPHVWIGTAYKLYIARSLRIPISKLCLPNAANVVSRSRHSCQP